MRGVYAIVYKDLKRLLKHKGTLLVSFATPLLFVILSILMYSSLSFESILWLVATVTILSALLPSIVSGLFFAIEIEFRMLKDIIASPLSKHEIMLGKIFSSLFTILVPVTILLVFAFLAGFLKVTVGAIISIILTCFFITCFSLTLALIIKKAQAFQMVSSFVNLGALFFSNAVLPIAALPEYVRWLILLNPITYGIDLFRTSVGFPNELPLIVDFSVLIIACTLGFFISINFFEKEYSNQ